MPSVRVNKNENFGMYFLTFTVFKWYSVLNKHNHWIILADSIRFFQKHKNLKLNSFVFMNNHIHLIIESDDVISFIRDFKKFTSKKIKENIILYEPTILNLFINESYKYQFWQRTNMPIEIYSEKFWLEKSKYIENNPVVKGYVDYAEDWIWSSANPNCSLEINEEY
jgi:REP element-mobilizing transposase RayT